MRDKLKKNTRMLARARNEKLDELKASINDLSNRIQNLEIIKDRKIPAHEKLDKATIFYKHFMKLMAAEKLEETAQNQAKEDKEMLKEIGDGIEKIGLFANRTFKAKRFTKEGDGLAQKLRVFVKYYIIFTNSYNGLPSEIQKQFRKTFNKLFEGKNLGDLMTQDEGFELKHALAKLKEEEVQVFIDKLIEEEVIDFEK